MLRPQDVLIAARLLGRDEISAPDLAAELGLSISEAYNALDRCRSSGLIAASRSGEAVSRRMLSEIVCYAIPGLFYAERGSVADGMRTARHAPCLDARLKEEAAIPLVWPREGGGSRGESLLPLYPTVPEVCSKDETLYEIFAMIDVVRIGGAAERRLARELLDRRIVGRRNAGG